MSIDADDIGIFLSHRCMAWFCRCNGYNFNCHELFHLFFLRSRCYTCFLRIWVHILSIYYSLISLLRLRATNCPWDDYVILIHYIFGNIIQCYCGHFIWYDRVSRYFLSYNTELSVLLCEVACIVSLQCPLPSLSFEWMYRCIRVYIWFTSSHFS